MHKDDRPHPLRHEATIRGIIGTVAIGGTLLGVTQVADLPTLIEPVVIAFSSGGVLYATRSAAKAGEQYVTPIDDPRDNAGNKLVPEVAQPESYRL